MKVQLYSVNTNNYEKSESKHILIDDIHCSLMVGNLGSDRLYKMFPHKFFGADISVYCDANMTLVKPERLLELCETLINSVQSAIFFKHPDRTSTRQEILECISRQLLPSTALQTYNRWRTEGFKDDINLMENNVLIRKTNCTDLQKCEDVWYDEYKKGMMRDQPILPYAIWKTNYTNFILMEQQVKEDIFKWRPHGC